MKRILLVLTVALMMAAMFAVMVAPAFAATPACESAKPNDKFSCHGNKLSTPGGHHTFNKKFTGQG